MEAVTDSEGRLEQKPINNCFNGDLNVLQSQNGGKLQFCIDQDCIEQEEDGNEKNSTRLYIERVPARRRSDSAQHSTNCCADF